MSQAKPLVLFSSFDFPERAGTSYACEKTNDVEAPTRLVDIVLSISGPARHGRVAAPLQGRGGVRLFGRDDVHC